METNKASIKQHTQLIVFIRKTQSFIISDEIPLLEIMKHCTNYSLRMRIDNIDFSSSLFRDLDKMMKRYYPYGFKENKNARLTPQQYKTIQSIANNIRFSTSIFPSKAKPIEKILFIRTLRACYKLLTSKYKEEDKQALRDSLEQIRVFALE